MGIHNAETALIAATSTDPNVRHGRYSEFMQEVGKLLEHPEIDRVEFAARTAPLLASTTLSRLRWNDGMLSGIDGGDENDALESLHRRTQLEVAVAIYRDTAAAQYFEDILDEDSDDQLRERAQRFGFYAPDYVPTSHRWWLQK